MSLHRFFLPAPFPPEAAPGQPVALPLSPGDLRHLDRVLRLRPGARIVVVSPDGSQHVVALTGVASTVLGVVEERLPARREPRVTLVQGVGKGHKTDLVVEKATEIGAGAVMPVLTARTVVRLDGRKREERGDRWRRVAAEAAKQAQRASIPRVDDPVGLSVATARLEGFDRIVVVWEEARGAGMADALRGVPCDGRVAVVVGPEGGLTAEEVDELREAGAVVATLGENVLRTETAGIVALALAIHELGGLGRTDV